MNRKYNLIIIFTFIFTLFSLLFLSVVWPKRTLLKDENRTANPFPSFNWQSIKDGSFSQGFEQYYADQFPFRSAFMGLDKQVKLLLSGNVVKSKDDVQVFYNKKGDLGRGENLQDFDALKNSSSESPSPSVLSSESEQESNMNPEEIPTTSASLNENNASELSSENEISNVESIESTETSEVHTDPAKLPRVAEDEVENIGSVIMVGDRARDIYYHNEEGILAYVSRLNDLANELTNSQLYSLPTPTSV